MWTQAYIQPRTPSPSYWPNFGPDNDNSHKSKHLYFLIYIYIHVKLSYYFKIIILQLSVFANDQVCVFHLRDVKT